MRAWQVHRHGEPADALRLVDVPPPEAGPGELLLTVGAAAVGMPDLFMCRGTYPLTPPLPFTPGQEIAGVVTAAGDGAGIAVGTRVMGVSSFVDGRGGFAEQAVVSTANAYPVPDAMGDAEAAAFRIGFATAWVGLVRRGALQAGERVLVLGAAGGSGAAAVQLGRALGAEVIAVVGGDAKAEWCRELGASAVVDHRRVESVPAAVRDLTGGAGVDVVFDPVGGAAGEDAMRCLANEGRFLCIGFAAGRWPDVDVARAVGRNYSVVGVYVGAYDRTASEADHRALLELVGDGRLHSTVSHTVPLTELVPALEAVARGDVIGKIVVVP